MDPWGFAKTLLAALALGRADDPVVLEVVAPQNQLDGWPRPCGITAPPALLRPGERLGLFEAGGSERPARVVAWATDGRGAPRLVRVEIDELPRSARRFELRSTHLALPPPRLVLEGDRNAFALHGAADAGALAWRDATLTISSGATRLELPLARLGLADDGDERRPTRVGPPRLLGPDGAGAELTIPIAFDAADDARPGASVLLRCSLPSSAKVAELEFVLVAPRDLLVRQLVLRGRIVEGAATLRRGAREVAADRRGTRVTSAPGMVGLLAPEEVADAIAPLALVGGDGGARVELRWPDFGVERPSGASLRADGSFALYLVAEPLLVHEGQTLRRNLMLARGDRCGSPHARPFVVARDDALPLDEPTRAWLAPWREFLQRWLARPRRIDDRGCYPEPWGVLSNGEYDLGGGLLWLGALERDATWLTCGEIVARHTLSWDRGAAIDVPRGLFFQHGDDHCSGKVEAGHQWVGGALGLARAAGSLAALDAARGVVAGLAQWRGQPGRFAGPERRLAWPLRVAVEVSDAIADPAARDLGDALLRDLLSRQQLGGFLDGDRRPTREGSRVWINSWVSLGITVDALVRAERAWPGAGAADAARRLARFVADEALEQERLAEVLLVEPDFGTVAEKRGRVGGGDAALAAAGLLWLARTTGDPALHGASARIREVARTQLAAPSEAGLVELAKALLALRFERDTLAAPPPRQSLSSPSSVRTGRPREKR